MTGPLIDPSEYSAVHEGIIDPPAHVGLKALGEGKTTYQYLHPDPEVLEKFPNPHFDTQEERGESQLIVEITAPEFSSLCPKTGQPDYATIEVSYEPLRWCVESKSFKLYLMGFRMHGEFHESCVNRIGKALVRLLEPRFLRVTGKFTPRGGIAFWPSYEFRAHEPE